MINKVVDENDESDAETYFSESENEGDDHSQDMNTRNNEEQNGQLFGFDEDSMDLAQQALDRYQAYYNF